MWIEWKAKNRDRRGIWSVQWTHDSNETGLRKRWRIWCGLTCAHTLIRKIACSRVWWCTLPLSLQCTNNRTHLLVITAGTPDTNVDTPGSLPESLQGAYMAAAATDTYSSPCKETLSGQMYTLPDTALLHSFHTQHCSNIQWLCPRSHSSKPIKDIMREFAFCIFNFYLWPARPWFHISHILEQKHLQDKTYVINWMSQYQGVGENSNRCNKIYALAFHHCKQAINCPCQLVSSSISHV